MTGFSDRYFTEMKRAMQDASCRDGEGRTLPVPDACDAVSEMILKCGKSGRKVIIVGNGGSASIASHISVDLWKNGKIRSVAFNDSSLLTCLANDLGYEQVFSAPVGMFADSGDILIAISSSGKSKNILNAAAAAKNAGCAVITLSGFSPDNPLSKTGAYNFFVPSSGYAFVETIHSAICHAFVDSVIASSER